MIERYHVSQLDSGLGLPRMNKAPPAVMEKSMLYVNSEGIVKATPGYRLELPVKAKGKIRGTRRDRSEAVIRRRLNDARWIYQTGDWYDQLAREPNRLNKRHWLDCGQARCFWCHADKLSGDKPVYYRRRYGI